MTSHQAWPQHVFRPSCSAPNALLCQRPELMISSCAQCQHSVRQSFACFYQHREDCSFAGLHQNEIILLSATVGYKVTAHPGPHFLLPRRIQTTFPKDHALGPQSHHILHRFLDGRPTATTLRVDLMIKRIDLDAVTVPCAQWNHEARIRMATWVHKPVLPVHITA